MNSSSVFVCNLLPLLGKNLHPNFSTGPQFRSSRDKQVQESSPAATCLGQFTRTYEKRTPLRIASLMPKAKGGLSFTRAEVAKVSNRDCKHSQGTIPETSA